MKKKELAVYREKSEKELETLIQEKRKGILHDYTKRTMGNEKNVKKVRLARKELAQLLTILREKEISRKEAGNS